MFAKCVQSQISFQTIERPSKFLSVLMARLVRVAIVAKHSTIEIKVPGSKASFSQKKTYLNSGIDNFVVMTSLLIVACQ